MNNNQVHIDEIKKRLSAVVKKESVKKSLMGINTSFSVILLAFILFVIAESVGRFKTDVRTVLFYSLLLFAACSIVYLAIVPYLKGYGIFSKPNFFKIASRVGSHFPDIKDDLINSLQLISSNNKYRHSDVLVEKAFERTYNRIKNLDFTSIIDFTKMKKYFRISAASILLTILLLLVPFIQNSALRLINYDKEFIIPPKFSFSINPGDAKVTKGDDITITVNVEGDNLNSISLLTKSVEESEFTAIDIQSDTSGNFKHTFKTLNSSFEYYASSQNIVSPRYNIEVINRPVIRGLEAIISSPYYSKIPRAVQKDNGNITALPGSRISLRLNSTKPIANAEIIFSDSSRKQLRVKEDSAFAEFKISKSVDYSVKLIDHDSNSNINPVTYSITSLTDEYPILEVVSPDADVKLSNQNNISLQTDISDDYGFTKLVLNYKLTESRYEQPWEQFSQIEIPFNNRTKEEEVFYNWNLTSLNLAVEDVVSYYVEVFDNDHVNGPKSAKSKLYKIRVPSLDELFNQADETHETAQNDLQKTLEEAQKLNEEFEKISDELKQDNKELSFEEKEKIKNALEKFEELGNKVDEVQKKLSEMQENLQQNDLLSQETLEKYMELQQLMDELTGDEYKDALQKMQEMLEKLQRDQAQNAFEDMKLNEESFKKSIERTLNLLKRIQIEQKVDELLKRSEELSKKQDELQEKTNNQEQSDTEKEELDQKQEEISKEVNDFKNELEKLKEKLSEVPDMPREQMEKILEEFEKQNNEQLSESARQKMQQNQMQQAMQMQQQVSKNMSSMNQQLQELQQQMQMQNRLQTLQDMMKIIDNILSVSKEQEKLKDSNKELSFNSPQLNRNAQKQSELKNDLSKILQQMGNAAQKTFAITPEMAKSIGKAATEMNQSINSMQNGNASAAVSNQNSAMANLNEAATMMNNMLQNMMNGNGSGGGMMSLMQQMQQLSQQQMQLNQMTQMLNKGSLSQQQMQQLQRLAQEQDVIRKSLEQLNKESKLSGQSKKMPASLERILEEMKEVVTDMRTEKLGDDLIQKQERILSKLLDAQKSINERDYEKERESFAGKNIRRESPPELLLNTEEGRDKLRDELLKAIREGYLKDYEDLIRRYYEALQAESTK